MAAELTKELLEQILIDYGEFLDDGKYQDFFDAVYKLKYSTDLLKQIFAILCEDGDDDNEVLKSFDIVKGNTAEGYFHRLLEVPVKTVSLNITSPEVLPNSYFGHNQRPAMEVLILGPDMNSCPTVNYQPNLRQIIIKSNSTHFGRDCLAGNPKLKEIDIEGKIRGIGERAFANNPSLETLDLTNYESKVLPENLFKNDKNLKTVVLPPDIVKIPAGMFSGCHNLETIFLPDSVEKLEAGAFYGCDKVQIRMNRRPDGKGIKIPQGDLDFYKQHLKIKK